MRPEAVQELGELPGPSCGAAAAYRAGDRRPFTRRELERSERVFEELVIHLLPGDQRIGFMAAAESWVKAAVADALREAAERHSGPRTALV